MIGPDDVTPELRAWLKEPVTLSEDGASEIPGLVHDTPQQRGWLPPLPRAGLTRVLAFAGGTVTGAIVVLLGVLLLLSVSTDPEPAVPAASSPSPSATAGPPTWEGVRFEPVDGACVSGCEEHPGRVWSVEADHHGDFGSAEAIAFGNDGAPWFLSDGTIWQLGRLGTYPVPGSGEGYPIEALLVAPDGSVWVGDGSGLYSFDGSAWTEHWTETGIVALDVSPDGAIYGLGGGRGVRDIVVVRADEGGISGETVDVIDPERWPIALAVDGEGRVWISAIGSGYVAPVEGESLVAYSDGAGWATVRPFDDETDVAAWSLARGPQGALRWHIDALDRAGGLEWYVGRAEGPYWEVHASSLDGGPDPGVSMALDADGGPWFSADVNESGDEAGLLAWRGWTWTRYLADREVLALAAAADGFVVAATIPGFDDAGELFVLSHDAQAGTE